MRRTIVYCILFLITGSMCFVNAQPPSIRNIEIKVLRNGVLRLKLVIENKSKNLIYITSNKYNELHEGIVFSNCSSDSIDFMFSSNGVRESFSDSNTIDLRVHDRGAYLSLMKLKGNKVKYLFNYELKCSKTMYYVIRYSASPQEFYKCIVELSPSSITKPVVRIIPIKQIDD